MGDSLGETELEDRARLDSSISHRAQAMARVVELEANTRSRAQAAALAAAAAASQSGRSRTQGNLMKSAVRGARGTRGAARRSSQAPNRTLTFASKAASGEPEGGAKGRRGTAAGAAHRHGGSLGGSSKQAKLLRKSERPLT